MNSAYDSILGDARYGDEVVLNTSQGDSGILELLQRLKDGRYKVVEEEAGRVVLREKRLPDDMQRMRDESTSSMWKSAFWDEFIPSYNFDGLDDLFEGFPVPQAADGKPGPIEDVDDDPANWNWAIEDAKVENKEMLKVTLENHDDQTIFVLLYFKTAYRNRGSDFSKPSTTELRLVLDEVRFGVENSVLTKDELGAFVHQIAISVQPAPSWLKHCDRLRNVRPALTPPMFEVHVGSSRGVGLTLGTDPNAVLNYQTTKSITTTSPAFAWRPASSTWRNKSVEWAWKINRWNDSTPFDAHRPSSFSSRFGTGELRELPFHRANLPPGEVNYSRNLLDAEAVWEVPTAAIEKSGFTQWTVTVRLLTAHVRRIIIIPPNLALKCRVTKGRFDFESEVSLKVETNVD